MGLKNASVVLTYKVEGALKIMARYDYRERTSSGSILPENQRLFTVVKHEDSDCFKRVILGEHFVNYAISDSSRPSSKGTYKDFEAYKYWARMSQEQRLLYHVAKYAHDVKAKEFTYLINEE